jgi:ABC-type glycerol-3-phosphate transport system substrate-binding protein
MRYVATLLALPIAVLAACHRGERTLVMAAAVLPSELPVYREVIADWERETGRRVIVVPQQYPDIRRALAAEAFAGHGTLDLVELDVYSLAAVAPYVAVLDIGKIGPTLDALAPFARQAGQVDGLRFLPQRIAWQALIYDDTVLAQPPQTWSELLDAARLHPQQLGIKGALYEGLTCDVLPFVWAAGGSGDVLDDAGAIRAFRFLAELAPYLNPQSATFKESTVAEAMARGEIVLHLNWPFVMSLYASEGLAPERFRSAPLPRGPDGRFTVLGGGYLALPRRAPHGADALRLLDYLTGQHAQEEFARRLGWFSARRDVAMAGNAALLGGFLAMRGDVRPRSERPDYARLSRLWQQSFRAVVFDHTDPVATLHAAQRELAGRE